MADNPVRQIVERVLEASAGNLAAANMNGSTFRDLKHKCRDLIAAYDEYQLLVAEYKLLVADNAKLKRQIKKYQRQGLDTTSLSAQLDSVRQQQEEQRKKDDLLGRAKAGLTKIYKCVFHLQTLVNRLLGQEISMAYVSQRGGTTQVVKLDKEITQDLYSLDIDRYGNFVLRYNIAAIEQGIRDLTDAQKENKLITSKITTGMQTLLLNIQERMNIAKAHNSTNLLWKSNGVWKMTNLNNFGDLLEAYVAMLINGDEHAVALLDSIIGDVDAAIDVLVTQYLTAVDNASGFFQEDVQVNNTNQYFGIKSAGASLMGFEQVVQFARLIMQTVNTGQIDSKAVARLERKFKGSTKTRHAVELVVEDEYTTAIEEGIEELHQTMAART